MAEQEEPQRVLITRDLVLEKTGCQKAFLQAGGSHC